MNFAGHRLLLKTLRVYTVVLKSGLGMCQDQQGLPRQFYKEQLEKKGPTKEAMGG